jgi:hypothetical protein
VVAAAAAAAVDTVVAGTKKLRQIQSGNRRHRGGSFILKSKPRT